MTPPPWWALVAGLLISGAAIATLVNVLLAWLDSRTPRPPKHRTAPSRRLPMAHSPKQEN